MVVWISHDQRLDYLQGNIVDNSTRISANEDAIKALKGQVVNSY